MTTQNLRNYSELFEAENPDITIEPVDIASDDYDTKVTTMLSSGDTTDILTMKNLLSYSNYALRNQLVDLTDHVKDLDIEPAKASSRCMKSMVKPMLSLTVQISGYCITIKKCLMKPELPIPDNLTWDEYEALAKKLSKPEEQVYGAYQHTWLNGSSNCRCSKQCQFN